MIPAKIGSYPEEDVTFLLKDISDLIDEKGNEEREYIIQNGGHYSEMLPIEYEPTEEYIELFHKVLDDTKEKVAQAAAHVSELIYHQKKGQVVLVSLARAGTPIGILIKRYLESRYSIVVPHYSISIIRGRGIDENALQYILERHDAAQIQFVDGWTGKGAILRELKKALSDYNEKYGVTLDDELAVLADPGYCVSLYGTRDDFLIPSASLNATVSGLVSRTVLRKDIIGSADFHGVKYYRDWKQKDVSNYFVNAISKCFDNINITEEKLKQHDFKIYNSGVEDTERIREHFLIHDINLVKPGVGETTRVLLRRVPWKILVDSIENPNLKHILLLAEDRNVPIEVFSNMKYSCCGLIKAKGES